jgi:hypothetical protein
MRRCYDARGEFGVHREIKGLPDTGKTYDLMLDDGRFDNIHIFNNSGC